MHTNTCASACHAVLGFLRNPRPTAFAVYIRNHMCTRGCKHPPYTYGSSVRGSLLTRGMHRYAKPIRIKKCGNTLKQVVSTLFH